MTKYHRLGVGVGFNNRYLFLTILEAGNSNIQVLASLVPGEGSLSGLHFAGSSHGRETQRDSKLPGVSCFESTFPIMRTHPHDLI